MPSLAEQLEDLRIQLAQLKLTAKKNVPAIPLPKFKGRIDGRPFATFLDEFNAVALAMDWEDQVKCQMIPASLEGEANAIYHTLTNAIRNDWKLLLTELGKRLAASTDTNYHRMQLQNRNQKDNESVSEYGRAMRFLVRRAFPDSDGITDDVRKKFEVDYFIGGLKPHVKEQMMRRDRADTLEEAIIEAQKEETLQRDIRRDYETRSLALNAICLAEKQRDLQEQIDEIKQLTTQTRHDVAFVQNDHQPHYDDFGYDDDDADNYRGDTADQPNWSRGRNNDGYESRRYDQSYRRWDSRSPAQNDRRKRYHSPPPNFIDHSCSYDRPRNNHRSQSIRLCNQSPRNTPRHAADDEPIRPRYHVSAVRHLQFPCFLIALLALTHSTMAFKPDKQRVRQMSIAQRKCQMNIDRRKYQANITQRKYKRQP